jgi:hypothetical protein
LNTEERAVFSSESVISRCVVSSTPRTTDKVMGSTSRDFDFFPEALAAFISSPPVRRRRASTRASLQTILRPRRREGGGEAFGKD